MSLRDEVEVLADYWRAGATLPVDVDAIALEAGLRFEYVEFDKCAGATVIGLASHSSTAVIIQPRRRLTKAHELAHFLSDEPRPGWRAPASWTYSGDWHEPHEYFAASILMPRRWIRDLTASQPRAPAGSSSTRSRRAAA